MFSRRSVLVSCVAVSLIGASATIVSAAESTLDVVTKRGKIIVGVRFDTPPYGYIDDQKETVGLDIDIAKYIAERLKVQLELVQVTGQTRIPMLTSGRVDMLVSALSVFRKRTEVVDFTIPYFYDGAKVMVRKGSPIRSFADLAGKRVSTVQGTPFEKLIAAAYPTAKILAYQEYPQARLAVKQDLADAMVTDSVVLAGLVAGDNDLEIVGDFVTMAPLAIGVRYDDSKWRITLSMLIQDMWNEGKYKTAYDKYFGPTTKFPLPLGFKIETWPE